MRNAAKIRDSVVPPVSRFVSKSVFHFCDKRTGMSIFQVESLPDGQLPVDYAAGLLAMQCMVRGQRPSDYMILTPATGDQVESLDAKAQSLLNAGRKVDGTVKLSRRETEVLDGVVGSLANKEIAIKLNLSERTIKFHVSSLLAKFRVRGRMELMREVYRHNAVPLPQAG